MLLILNFWWLWLVILVASSGYVIFNQIARFKRLTKHATSDSFFEGITGLAVAGVSASISGIFLVISIIMFVVTYHQ